jgi:hypothetical protein
VGLARQTLQREGDSLVVTLDEIDVGPARRRGFGTAWTNHLERWYRASGVTEVRLFAMRAGAYVWARLGYEWVDEGEARRILEHLRALLVSPADRAAMTPSEEAAARAVLDRVDRFAWGDSRFPTVAEIAEIGWGEPRPSERPEHLGQRVLDIGWHGRKPLR